MPNTADQPLTILLVHNRYRIPGGEDTVFDTERRLLEQRGYKMVVYERSNAEPMRLSDRLTLPFTVLWSRRACREVRALIRREKPDIVHVHNTLLLVSPGIFRVVRAEGVPCVMTLHNFRLMCPNGIFLQHGQICERCAQSSLLCAAKYRCYRNSRVQSALVAAMLALHRALHTWQGIWAIAPTDFDRNKFLEYSRRLSILDPERLLVKAHPVQSSSLPPLSADQRRNWLFAGRLEELKGVRTLLTAWEQLPQEHLLIAGDGPLESECRSIAAEKRLNIEFLGRVPHDRLTGLQRQCRATIVPSLCYESFGLAAAESLMNGTPVIGSDLGNTGAMIRPGENGLRFAAGDPASLVNAVLQLKTLWPALDPAFIQAQAAREFAPEQTMNRLENIYRQILAAESG